MDFAYILELMTQKGISQKQLADRIGVSQQKVSDWKRGTVMSWNKRLPEIAGALGMSVDELLNNEKKPATENGDELTQEEIEFIVWYRSLSDKQRDALKSFYGIG